MLKRKPIRILISLLVAAIALIYLFMFRQFYVRQFSPFEGVKAFYAIGDILDTSGISVIRNFHILPQSAGFSSRYAYDISGDIFFTVMIFAQIRRRSRFPPKFPKSPTMLTAIFPPIRYLMKRR